MDRTIYTKDDLVGRIREIRLLKDLLTDEEGRLVLLHSASVEHGTPVDSRGRSLGKPRKTYTPQSPAIPEVLRALERGTTVRLPAFQGE